MKKSDTDSFDFDAVVSELGGASLLTATARSSGALKRARGIRDGADFLRLALLYGPAKNSLRSVAGMMVGHGVDISDAATEKRLKAAGPWLAQLCNLQLEKLFPRLETAGDRPVRVIDGSRIDGPGKTAFRLHLLLDLANCTTADLRLTTTKEGEKHTRLRIDKGEIRLADRGLAHPDGLAALLDGDADFVQRVSFASLHILDVDTARPLDWTSVFEICAATGVFDRPVLLAKAKASQEIFPHRPIRLVALPLPEEGARKALKRVITKNHKDDRETINPLTMKGSGFLILATSLDAKEYPPERLAKLYSGRWQIELAFKRLKSIMKFGEPPTRDEELTRTWLLAHLLVALLAERLLAEAGATSP
jgi:hypothetical protein